MSNPMVRALLDGSKTQTRRILKADRMQHDACIRWDGDSWLLERHPVWERMSSNFGRCDRIKCPYGQVGDILIVKEATWLWCERRPNGQTKTGRPKWHYVPLREAPVFYVADHPEKPTISVVSPETGKKWGWRYKVGRFMPRWASRIKLEITDVRVERLQDISEEDAKAEGAQMAPWAHPSRRYIGGFEEIWTGINGPGSWSKNPHVWALSFRRIGP